MAKMNLATLPAPDVVEQVEFEDVFEEIKADVIELYPELEPVLGTESAVASKILQACAGREMRLRVRVNDASKSNLLAFALGGDLVHIGATHDIEKLEGEEQERFRERIPLGIEAYSVAGPEGAYIFHPLSADLSIRHVAVDNPHDNRIDVTILSEDGNGEATDAQLSGAVDALSPSKTRPMTDDVRVRSATIFEEAVVVRIIVARGPAPAALKAQAEKNIRKYCDDRHRIGRALRVGGIDAAARAAGEVEQVVVEAPTADVIPGKAGAVFVPSIDVQTEVMP